jgi:hypothetical protein
MSAVAVGEWHGEALVFTEYAQHTAPDTEPW